MTQETQARPAQQISADTIAPKDTAINIRAQGDIISKTIICLKNADGSVSPYFGAVVNPGQAVLAVNFEATLTSFCKIAKPVRIADSEELRKLITPKASRKSKAKPASGLIIR